MVIQLPIKYPLGQTLLQLIDQTAALEYGRRVTSRQQLIHHFIRDPTLAVRRHTFSSRPIRASLYGSRTQNFRHTLRSRQRWISARAPNTSRTALVKALLPSITTNRARSVRSPRSARLAS